MARLVGLTAVVALVAFGLVAPGSGSASELAMEGGPGGAALAAARGEGESSVRPAAYEYRLVGHTGGSARAVVADATTAWIAEGIGVSAFDISDEQQMVRVAHQVIDTASDVWSLARHGRTLYAGGAGMLYALDVADRSAPELRGTAETSGRIRGLTIYAPPGEVGHWVLATDDETGVRVFASNAEGDLAHVADLPGTEGASARAALAGTIAIAPGDDALLFSVADPTAPEMVGRIETAGRVRGVAAVGEWLYVADSVEGLLAVPLPDADGDIGDIEPSAALPGVGAGRLFTRGSNLYVLEEHGTAPNTVRLIDISDPGEPDDLLGGESTYAVLRGAADLAPVGDALLAARSHVVTRADVSERYWPEVRSEAQVTWPLQRLADAGPCVYAARGEPGLDVVATMEPGGARVEAAWRPPGGTLGAYYHDGFLYVSDAGGFGRFDASSPCAPVPRELPFAPHWAPTRWISAHGSRLVATSSLELYVADLRGENFPRERARVRYDVLPGWPAGAVAKDIVLRDESLAYVAAGTAGTAVLSLEDPAAPFVRRVEPPPEGLDVQAVDASADQLAAGSSDGVLLYDLSDPLAPRLVSVALRGVSAVGLDLDEGWLHVAADMDGLRLLDVTDPSEPAEVAAVTAPYSFNSVVASGQRVYAAGAGLLIFELDAVPDPTATTTPSATPVTPTETATGTPTTEPTPTQPPTATTDPHLDAKRCLVPLVLR